ncbi:MAG: hypothetical protein IMZ67_09195 [Acidobacteria bacterium]|nr:hypothetical protein [Acidobacteriota bacterium]
MSALRISTPDHRPTFIDLGPARWVPLHGHATLRGHMVVPPSTEYHRDGSAAQRVRAFRERHEGRVAR